MNRFLTASARYVLATFLALLALLPLSVQSQAPEDVTRGVEWLSAQVQPGGGLEAEALSIATPLQNRAEAARTLKLLSNLPAHLAHAVDSTPEQHIESLSRRVMTRVFAGESATTLISEMRSRQNVDGGFGGAPGYESNALDTAYALLAFHAANASATSHVSSAVSFLLTAQRVDGGFSLASNDSNLYVTALVSRSLQLGSNSVTVLDAVNKANDWLLSNQRPDGGWGDAATTSLIYLALLGTNSDTGLQGRIATAILSQQGPNGSWNGDPFVTALALRALTTKPVPLQTTGSITGKILDGATGHPFAGASVAIEQIGSLATSDADGGFSFPGVTAGDYSLAVSSQGYATRTVELLLQPGTTMDVGSIALAPRCLST